MYCCPPGHSLAKVGVEGSNPFARSNKFKFLCEIDDSEGSTYPSPISHGGQLDWPVRLDAISKEEPYERERVRPVLTFPSVPITIII
jgi:hypothetical protein